jgi:hypothetical protein
VRLWGQLPHLLQPQFDPLRIVDHGKIIVGDEGEAEHAFVEGARPRRIRRRQKRNQAEVTEHV